MQKRYVVIGALSFVVAMHASDQAAASTDGKLLRFVDCFDQKEIMIPGQERHYAPVAAHRYYKRKQDNDYGFCRSEFIQSQEGCDGLVGYVGFIEGQDKELVAEVAAMFSEALNSETWTCEGQEFVPKAANLDDFLHTSMRRVIAGDFERNDRARGITHRLFGFEVVSKKNPTLLRSGSTSDYVLPAAVKNSFERVKYMVLEHAAEPTRMEKVQECAKHLAQNTKAATHTAIYLQLNAKKAQDFVAQLSAD